MVIYKSHFHFFCFMKKGEISNEEFLQKLGKRLKDLRKSKGYSNYELFAFDNEIPRAQYGRYEKGSDLRITSLLKVLKALDMSIKDFFNEGFEE
jgi:transcriptional regulator with XRE-family HTH domain